jgi:hypothetical protein
LAAIVGFLSLPFLVEFESQDAGFALTMVCAFLVSGYFMGASLTQIAAECSRIDSSLIQIFFIGNGVSPVIANLLRMISVLCISNQYTNAIIFGNLSAVLMMISSLLTIRLFNLGQKKVK